MKDKIQTNVQLMCDGVELNIAATKNLKKEKGNLKNFGYIQVSTGMADEKHPCFWDNLNFFLKADFKTFKEECKEDLKKGNFPPKKTYETIKRLLKRATKLKIIETITIE